MHSALLALEKPSSFHLNHSAAAAWTSLLSEIGSFLRNRTVEQLADGIFLIDLQAGNGLDTLAGIVHRAEMSQIKRRVLFFDEAPRWVEGQ